MGSGGVGGALGDDVAFDGEGELGEVGVADDAAELALGFEHSRGRPTQAHLARLPALDVAAGAADGLDHRLARVRRCERALEPAANTEAGDGERLLDALSERRGGAGVGAREFVGERAQSVEREVVVVERPRRAQPAADGVARVLGQVAEHVAFSLISRVLSSRFRWSAPPWLVSVFR
jgi:hypothetical protein